MQQAIRLPPMPLFSTMPVLTRRASTLEFSSSTAPPPAKRRRRTLITALNNEQYDTPAHEDVCNGIHGTTHLPCTNAASPSKDCRYLPMCKTHKQLRIRAGRCKYQPNPLFDTRCGRLFRWRPPHFELCLEHTPSPQERCHLFELPPELRFMVFRYLLPEGPYDSADFPETDRGATTMNLLLTNRQVSTEVRSLLYSEEPFVINISEQGVYMLGRSLYSPRDAFGKPRSSAPPLYLSTYNPSHKQIAQLQDFSYSSMRQCIVKISMVNRGQCPNHNSHVNAVNGRCFCCNDWDEEVELYDLRDIVYATLSILKVAAAGSLHSLAVQVMVNDYPVAKQREALEIVKTLTEPFATNLRDLKTVKLLPACRGIDLPPYIHSVNTSPPFPVPSVRTTRKHGRCLLSVTDRPRSLPLLHDPACSHELEEYRSQWEKTIHDKSALPLQWPIRSMFSWLKKFYVAVDSCVKVSDRRGRDCLLHRARVAREKNDVRAFHLVRDELVSAWTIYVEAQRKKERAMEKALCYMLDADTYVLQDMPQGPTWVGDVAGSSDTSQPATPKNESHGSSAPKDDPPPSPPQPASSSPQHNLEAPVEAIDESSSSFSSNQQGVSRQMQAQKQRMLQAYAQARMLPQQPLSAEQQRQLHIHNLQQQQRAFQAACRARIYQQQFRTASGPSMPMPPSAQPPPGSMAPYLPQLGPHHPFNGPGMNPNQPSMQSGVMLMQPCAQQQADSQTPDIDAGSASTTVEAPASEPRVKTESTEFRMSDFVQQQLAG